MKVRAAVLRVTSLLRPYARSKPPVVDEIAPGPPGQGEGAAMRSTAFDEVVDRLAERDPVRAPVSFQ